MRQAKFCLVLIFITLAIACSSDDSPSTHTGRVQRLAPTDKLLDVSASAKAAARSSTLETSVPEGMLMVPGGTFVMGQDGKGMRDEQPDHDVKVSSFFLDKTEVTNEAYNKCVEAGACRQPGHSDTGKSGFDSLDVFRKSGRPVSAVSHDDATTYCEWAGKRLPTEAEWERSARGSDGRLYPWGNEAPTSETAVFRVKVTSPAGSLPKGAGPYGHLDLGGNVWEWVSDRYDPYAYRRETASLGIPGTCEQIMVTLKELKRKKMQGFTGTNPIPDECEYVLRGGAFNYFPWGLRSSNRVHHPGRFRMIMAGFRCAQSLDSNPLEHGEKQESSN